MTEILKSFLMIFPEWLAAILVMVGVVVAALGLVRLGYGLFRGEDGVQVDRQRRGEVRHGCRRGEESTRYCGAARLHPGLAGLGNQRENAGLDRAVCFQHDQEKDSKSTWQRNPKKPQLWPISVRWGRTSGMTNEELEHRLTDVENRSKSNTRRLDGMEKADRCGKWHEHQHQADDSATRKHKQEP